MKLGMASVFRLLPALSRLRSWQLVALAAVLFLVDLLVPDPLPFVDEALLGLLTFWLSRRPRWRIRTPTFCIDAYPDTG